MTHSGYEVLLDALKNNQFDKIECRRLGKECCLVVYLGKMGEVFPNRNGDRMVFRNAWQWKDWLNRMAGLQVGDLPVIDVPIGDKNFG